MEQDTQHPTRRPKRSRESAGFHSCGTDEPLVQSCVSSDDGGASSSQFFQPLFVDRIEPNRVRPRVLRPMDSETAVDSFVHPRPDPVEISPSASLTSFTSAAQVVSEQPLVAPPLRRLERMSSLQAFNSEFG